MDTSYGVTYEQLEQMRRFVSANLDQYLLSSKLSLLRYGSKAVIDAPLSKDRDLLQSKLSSSLEKIAGERYIHEALLKIKNEIFTTSSLDSPNTPTRQIVLFVTGGNDPLKLNELSSIVKELKEERGVSFIYIGLGGDGDIPSKEMEMISSGLGSALKASFLPSIYDDLYKAIIRNAGK